MGTRYRLRLYLLAILVLLGLSVLVARLHKVQVVDYEYYRSRLPGEKQVTVRVPGVRGEIKDRNGVVLATNRASYEVTFDLRAILERYRENLAEGEEVPLVKYEAKEGGMTRPRTEPDIVQIVQETVIPEMQALGLAEGFNAEQMQVHFRGTSGLVPYSYRRDLTFDDFAVFAENDYNIPGVNIEVKPLRVYPFDALACHILGYLKLPDIQKVAAEKREEFDHYVADDYGGAGVEKSLDEMLQGNAGKRTMRRDEKGVIRGEISYVPPTAGADVYLTIDAKVQYIVEEAMRSIGRGAAVVMDPRNGDILAMVSVPSYNPNRFIPAVSPDDWNRYTTDESSPMYNRAMSQHPPGSTFKIPIALAGCLSNTNRRNFYCGGGVQYGNKFMQCWIGSKGGRHGSLDLSEAIKRSCNCYFYQYGNETGIRNIVDITSKMGLGHKTGIPLEGEMPGLVPTPEWLKLRGLVWSDAYTAMTSIGQGFTEATPLQMASVTCTVANGGKVFQPRLVRKVLEKDGTAVVPDQPVLQADLAKEGLTSAELEQVKRGMWKVVNEEGGTAGRARSPNFEVAGKTGTAQTGNSREPTNAWFISFAPYQEPELAVAIFIHNADSGGKCGAPIAGHIIKQIMAMKHGYVVEAKPMMEAVGNFTRIDLVDFDNVGLDQFVEGDDADAAVELPEGFAPRVVTSERGGPQDAPTLRARPDSRGSLSNIPPRAKKYPQARRPPERKGGFGGLFKKKGR